MGSKNSSAWNWQFSSVVKELQNMHKLNSCAKKDYTYNIQLIMPFHVGLCCFMALTIHCYLLNISAVLHTFTLNRSLSYYWTIKTSECWKTHVHTERLKTMCRLHNPTRNGIPLHFQHLASTRYCKLTATSNIM